MPTYRHPGVYIEEIPSGVKTIEGVSTSITAFVGPAYQGPVGEAVLVHSLDEYIATYGGVRSDDVMGFSVTAYFQNGGKDAYIARLVSGDAESWTASRMLAGEGTVGNVLKVSACSPGAWGNKLRIRVRKSGTADLSFTVEIGHLETDPRDGKQSFAIDETLTNLSMNSESPDYFLKRVQAESRLIAMELAEGITAQYQRGALTGASMPDAPSAFTAGVHDAMTMTINIDEQGAKRITLGERASLGLAGTSNAEDGRKLATAIQSAVVGLAPDRVPYSDFTCVYSDPDRKFVLTSGSQSSSSSVAVYGGDGSETDLARFIRLDPTSRPVSVQGAGKVVPAALSGTADRGGSLEGGRNGALPQPSDYRNFFDQRLVKIRDASIIVLPGQSMGKDQRGNGAIDAALSHCERTGRCMAIIDCEPGFELKTEADVNQLQLKPGTYGVLYYPWVEVSNPFVSSDGKPTILVAPSAFAAGMWAKIDGRRGVWKAPAGVESSLLGLAGLQFDVSDGDQDQLNPVGVNVLRKLSGFGHVIWGARTLSTMANPEWRYVPVRRTAIFIEQSIYNNIQWAVFEPNDHKLWASLRLNIEAFMNGLWRSGAFQGEKASDAYFVRCGLGDTMTQDDIDRGQVIVIVAFAPLKPAEFVIVRIQQKVAQQ